MYCRTCHYLLVGLTEHRCPECGMPFDPNDGSTFSADHKFKGTWLFRHRKAIVLLALLMVLLLVMTFANIPMQTAR